MFKLPTAPQNSFHTLGKVMLKTVQAIVAHDDFLGPLRIWWKQPIWSPERLMCTFQSFLLEPNHGQAAPWPQANYFQKKKKGSRTSRPDSKLPKGIIIYIENKRLLRN